MPKVNVEHSSSMKPEEAYAKIKTFFETDPDIRRFDPKMSCQFDDSKMAGKANGSQFKADMQVQVSGAGSKVVVTVDLPLLLSPFKGKVQEVLERKLGKHLA